MKIKKGDKFLCIKDVIMIDGELVYKKGEIYLSERDGCITDIQGDKDHSWDIDGEDNPSYYFKPIDKSTVYQDEYSWVNNGIREAESRKGVNINTQPHYDNTHGSLYQIAEQRGWNSYQFDIVKRIDRALKKGQFEEDLKKTKDLIDLWLREFKDEN